MKWTAFVLACGLLVPTTAQAAVPWAGTVRDTRYMAMGDSIAAGRGAIPQTEGYVYRLYHSGVIGTLANTFLSNAAVGDATSANVLLHQVPQAIGAPFGVGFKPDVVTITVGGNDLLALLGSPNPTDPALVLQVLSRFGENLTRTFLAFCGDAQLRTARVYISNQYEIPEIDALIPGVSTVVLALNAILRGVADAFGVPVVDVHGAFGGGTGLLLVERQGASPFEVHPTNLGHEVIAQEFERVIRANEGRLACPAP